MDNTKLTFSSPGKFTLSLNLTKPETEALIDALLDATPINPDEYFLPEGVDDADETEFFREQIGC